MAGRVTLTAMCLTRCAWASVANVSDTTLLFQSTRQDLKVSHASSRNNPPTMGWESEHACIEMKGLPKRTDINENHVELFKMKYHIVKLDKDPSYVLELVTKVSEQQPYILENEMEAALQEAGAWFKFLDAKKHKADDTNWESWFKSAPNFKQVNQDVFDLTKIKFNKRKDTPCSGSQQITIALDASEFKNRYYKTANMPWLKEHRQFKEKAWNKIVEVTKTILENTQLLKNKQLGDHEDSLITFTLLAVQEAVLFSFSHFGSKKNKAGHVIEECLFFEKEDACSRYAKNLPPFLTRERIFDLIEPDQMNDVPDQGQFKTLVESLDTTMRKDLAEQFKTQMAMLETQENLRYLEASHAWEFLNKRGQAQNMMHMMLDENSVEAKDKTQFKIMLWNHHPPEVTKCNSKEGDTRVCLEFRRLNENWEDNVKQIVQNTFD